MSALFHCHQSDSFSCFCKCSCSDGWSTLFDRKLVWIACTRVAVNHIQQKRYCLHILLHIKASGGSNWLVDVTLRSLFLFCLHFYFIFLVKCATHSTTNYVYIYLYIFIYLFIYIYSSWDSWKCQKLLPLDDDAIIIVCTCSLCWSSEESHDSPWNQNLTIFVWNMQFIINICMHINKIK